MILVIDDDAQIRRVLNAVLRTQGYRVLLAASGEDGITQALDQQPALIVLDLVMPGMGGMQVCEALRTWYRDPILILSVLEHDRDKITALKRGADDYISKPFSTGELLARIEAHLRRRQRIAAPAQPPVIVTGVLSIDLVHRRVTLAGNVVKLTPIEFELLLLLATNANCVVSTQTLQQHLWGETGSPIDSSRLPTHITHLRKKIAVTPSPIQTEHGIGYRFVIEAADGQRKQ